MNVWVVLKISRIHLRVVSLWGEIFVKTIAYRLAGIDKISLDKREAIL